MTESVEGVVKSVVKNVMRSVGGVVKLERRAESDRG
jgi:hypothetical protein